MLENQSRDNQCCKTYLFAAREVGRSNVQYLGHEIQVSRSGGFGARQLGSGYLSNVVAPSTTATNDFGDDGAAR